MADTDDALPSLKALIAFETTLRLGSLTAAARALGATQPAISQRIRGLEGQVGLVLFERSGAGLAPTREALRYYDEIAPALKRLTGATRELRARARSTRPRVLIAANFGFAHLWLLPRLARLEAAFPRVDIEVLAVDRDDQDHLADIAIHCDRESEPGDLFTPEEVFPVCSPAFAAAHGLEAGMARNAGWRCRCCTWTSAIRAGSTGASGVRWRGCRSRKRGRCSATTTIRC